jgi:hypothetical protein
VILREELMLKVLEKMTLKRAWKYESQKSACDFIQH